MGGGEALREGLAKALAGASKPQPAPARVSTARVSSVSGGAAQCVLAGDSESLTRVLLAGTQCAAGDTLAVVGQSGRWFAIGVLG